jgi:uncharacterized protein YlxW (UPF0749 family)
MQSLERRKSEAEQQIARCQRPIILLLTLMAPLYRRRLTQDARQLRRESRQLGLQLQDLQEKYETLRTEQQQKTSELEENTRLCEQEAVFQRDYRWIILQENRQKLSRRKAALEKSQEQERLREEALQLQQQQKTLQAQFNDLHDKISENAKRQRSLQDQHLDDIVPAPLSLIEK